MGSILLILDKGCVLPMLSKGFILSILDSMLFIAAASAIPLMAKATRVNEVNKRYPMMIGEVLVNQKTCAQTASLCYNYCAQEAKIPPKSFGLSKRKRFD